VRLDRRLVVFSLAAAFAVFCGVQDRITAAGARRYVSIQRAAIASGTGGTAIDDVMRPAVHQSVRQGLLWSGLVGATGLGAAAFIARRTSRG
jgi:hypothetical protein